MIQKKNTLQLFLKHDFLEKNEYFFVEKQQTKQEIQFFFSPFQKKNPNLKKRNGSSKKEQN
jgi:hypothetical protein